MVVVDGDVGVGGRTPLSPGLRTEATPRSVGCAWSPVVVQGAVGALRLRWLPRLPCSPEEGVIVVEIAPPRTQVLGRELLRGFLDLFFGLGL